MQTLDLDKDGSISFQEFSNNVIVKIASVTF